MESAELTKGNWRHEADTASDIRKKQFWRCFFIMRKGEPVEGNVILTGK